jgi:hypothetical protein
VLHLHFGDATTCCDAAAGDAPPWPSSCSAASGTVTPPTQVFTCSASSSIVP